GGTATIDEDPGWRGDQLHVRLLPGDERGGRAADGDVGERNGGAMEANVTGRLRAGGARGERKRGGDECGGVAGGHGVRPVRLFAVGEGVAGIDAARAGGDGGVDDVRI